MENMYGGLPRRTLFGHINGVPREFNVSTSIVEELIRPIMDGDDGDLNKVITKWDEQVMYYLPNGVFALEDEKVVIEYINMCIDDNVTNPYKL